MLFFHRYLIGGTPTIVDFKAMELLLKLKIAFGDDLFDKLVENNQLAEQAGEIITAFVVTSTLDATIIFLQPSRFANHDCSFRYLGRMTALPTTAAYVQFHVLQQDANCLEVTCR